MEEKTTFKTICKDCGCEFDAPWKNFRYCEKCREERNRASRARSRAKLYALDLRRMEVLKRSSVAVADGSETTVRVSSGFGKTTKWVCRGRIPCGVIGANRADLSRWR